MDGEIIASMGESRIGDEHTDEDDSQWEQATAPAGRVLTVDLDEWELSGASRGALFFKQRVKT